MNILRYGIDISYANKKLDFEKIKEGGVSFAIIRTGYRQKTDDKAVQAYLSDLL